MRFNILFGILLGLPLVAFATASQDPDVEIVLNIPEDHAGAHEDHGGIHSAERECTHSDCGKGKECYHGTATWYPVNWPVGDASWKDTEEYFKDKTGIYRYRLYKQPKPRIHQYTLSISVIDGGSGWGRTYTFEDQEGDQYGLTVFTDGDHYVDFDSHAPKITRVKDSET